MYLIDFRKNKIISRDIPYGRFTLNALYHCYMRYSHFHLNEVSDIFRFVDITNIIKIDKAKMYFVYFVINCFIFDGCKQNFILYIKIKT